MEVEVGWDERAEEDQIGDELFIPWTRMDGWR